MAKIVVETPTGVQVITQFPAQIGRAVENDIVIKSLGVATYHSEIIENGDGFLLLNYNDVYVDAKKSAHIQPLTQNCTLTLGTMTLGLWLDTDKPLLQKRPIKGWQLLIHPLAAWLWFSLALFMPMWTDYLETSTRYIMNWYLLFFTTVSLFLLVWLMHSIVFSIARQHFLLPLLGIVSMLLLLSDVLDEIIRWINFQYGFGGIEGVIFCGTAGIFFILFRAFLRDFVPLYGRWLSYYTVLLWLPCCLLLLYFFLESQHFFSQRPGNSPSYYSELFKDIAPGVPIQSIQQFLQQSGEGKM